MENTNNVMNEECDQMCVEYHSHKLTNLVAEDLLHILQKNNDIKN